jgi:hypothetical protein
MLVPVSVTATFAKTRPINLPPVTVTEPSAALPAALRNRALPARESINPAAFRSTEQFLDCAAYFFLIVSFFVLPRCVLISAK